MSTQSTQSQTISHLAALCQEDPGHAVAMLAAAGRNGDQLLWELSAYPAALESLSRWSECPRALKASAMEVLEACGQEILT